MPLCSGFFFLIHCADAIRHQFNGKNNQGAAAPWLFSRERGGVRETASEGAGGFTFGTARAE